MTDPEGAPDPKVGLEVLDRLLGRLKVDADARYYHSRWFTLRSANSCLYQPSAEDSIGISLRVVLPGGHVGVAGTSDLTPEGLARVADEAQALARVSPPIEKFPGFPPDPGSADPSFPFARDALSENAERVGERLAQAFASVETELGPSRISGVYNQGIDAVAVANTAGLRRGYRRSAAQASLLTEQPDREFPVSGWAEEAHWDPARVDLVEISRRAVRATPKVAPRAHPPGEYRVLLTGSAMTEVLGYIFAMSYGAHALEEGWSFLVGQEGKKLVSPLVTVEDDPLSSEGLPHGTDYEGLPCQRRPLIRDGVLEGPCHDTLTAARAGGRSTHNALPPEAPAGELGPVPTNLSLRPGTYGDAELLKALGTGILVTRFWYVRVVHPGKTLLTGMTRDGTYWVENGEIRHPIHNLRFTESVVRTLQGVEAVGRSTRAYADERGFFSWVLPSVVSSAFTFTSATTF